MSYTLLAGAGNNLALVRHSDDGEVYRYNFGWGTGIIAYQRADARHLRSPGGTHTWSYYGLEFGTITEALVWWTYERTPTPFEQSLYGARLVDEAAFRACA